MKTPTLIVRLCGLYLLMTSAGALLQVQKMYALAGSGMQQNEPFIYIQIFAGIGGVAGLAATLFAGPLARLLTFDSEPKTPSVSLSDQLLERKDEKA